MEKCKSKGAIEHILGRNEKVNGGGRKREASPRVRERVGSYRESNVRGVRRKQQGLESKR